MEFDRDSLMEIGTFLARRWSGVDDVTLEFAESGGNRTRQAGHRITLVPPEKLFGDDFERYRQFRTSLWYESMRLGLCEKILSGDHAYGFVLNALETRRVELLGRRTWRGMDREMVLNYAFQWRYRPQLGDVYGRARVVEAFYQYLLFGDIKGEASQSVLERARKAADLAGGIVSEAVGEGRGTGWLEGRVPDIVRVLGIDPLLTIPVSLPWMKPGMAMSQEEMLKAMTRISRGRGDDFRVDPADAMAGSAVAAEYRELVDESRRARNRGLGDAPIGIRIPPETGVDESVIYDIDLISRLRMKFRDWRAAWREVHADSGDELDEEAYLDGHRPFFTDAKKTINTEIMILLDHSSSISSEQLRYKKATLALCEVLAYLKVRFSVYAFSTADRAVVCWMIKPDTQRWGNSCAKRLARIAANGSTPLAEVYSLMYETLKAKRPKIFLTLTDGEPADPGAVRGMIRRIRSLGVGMAAIGLGPDVIRSTTIAGNLRWLGYERTLAASRLEDIPGKVIGVLEGAAKI